MGIRESGQVERRVSQTITHPGFRYRAPQTDQQCRVSRPAPQFANDIALLRLSSPVRYGATVRPVRLSRATAGLQGRTATVIGWVSTCLLVKLTSVEGRTRAGGSQSRLLREVAVRVWGQQDCKYENTAH